MKIVKNKGKTKAVFGFSPRTKLGFVAIFVALVGAYGVNRYVLNPYSADASTRVKQKRLYSFVIEKPIQLTKDSSTNLVKAVVAPRVVDVAADGSIYCTPMNGVDTVTRKLSDVELKQLDAKLKANKLEKPGGGRAFDVQASGYVNDFSSISLENSATPSVSFFFNAANQTPQFKQATKGLEDLCLAATQKVELKDYPDWESASVQTAQRSVLQRISQAIVPQAHAQSYPATKDTVAADVQFNRLDAYRRDVNAQLKAQGQQQIARLQRLPCMDASAEKWASYLATSLAWYHSLVGNLITESCGPNWTWAGENLAASFVFYNMGNTPDPADSDSVVVSNERFDSLLASPGHLANIVSPTPNVVGISVYQGVDGGMKVVQQFAFCASCPGFNSKSSTY